MEEKDFKYLVDKFEKLDLKLGKNFNGGCQKSPLPHHCFRIKPDQTLGGITERCEKYKFCTDYKYQYKV